MKLMPTIHDAPWTKIFLKKCYKDFIVLPENCLSIEASKSIGSFSTIIVFRMSTAITKFTYSKLLPRTQIQLSMV